MATINAMVKLWLCNAKDSFSTFRAAQKGMSGSLGINNDVSFIVFARANNALAPPKQCKSKE